MNQSHWTYWDDYGRQHVVGILHGADSGHLVVHCNSKVMLVDFEVKDSKTYSFCIDEHLCKLKVSNKSTGFAYELGVDENLNTPVYLKKKEAARQFLYQKIGSMVAAISLLILVALLFQSFK